MKEWSMGSVHDTSWSCAHMKTRVKTILKSGWKSGQKWGQSQWEQVQELIEYLHRVLISKTSMKLYSILYTAIVCRTEPRLLISETNIIIHRGVRSTHAHYHIMLSHWAPLFGHSACCFLKRMWYHFSQNSSRLLQSDTLFLTMLAVLFEIFISRILSFLYLTWTIFFGYQYAWIYFLPGACPWHKSEPY